MNTLDVIKEIVANNSDIELLTFSKYPMQTLIQDNISFNKREEKFISLALDIRKKYFLPFWDSLMLSFFDKKNVPTKLLSRALLHNENVEKIKTINIGKIEQFIKLNPRENISLNSVVTFVDGTVKHLFLLDFHAYPSNNNLKIISDILCVLDLHGYILNSGKSYHFISDSFFDLDALIDLLAKALLFSPIVDRAWVAHQLLERTCSIRVGEKNNLTPTVIEKV